jgi:hydrogenase-4 component F
LPPLGIFMSEFLVVTSTMARQPVLAIPLVLGLLVGFGALILRLQGTAFGEVPTRGHAPIKASLWPLWAHLALVATAGLYIPPQLVAWFRAVATLLG